MAPTEPRWPAMLLGCTPERADPRPAPPMTNRVAFPVSGATRVQPPYHWVDNIDAVDKFTPRFVTP
jgi:hypothetical protein